MMTVMYGVFDEEESRYLLYSYDFSNALLFVKGRGLGERLKIDMIDIPITEKRILQKNMKERDLE